MPDSQTPIRGQSATFSVNGAKRGDAVLLLYPDELTAVNTGSIGTWVYVLVPAVYLAVLVLPVPQDRVGARLRLVCGRVVGLAGPGQEAGGQERWRPAAAT